MKNESYWRARAERPSFQPLRGQIETQVTVIGGGITGLTTAYLLHRAGVDVVVVEALDLGGGTTGYSSNHLTTSIDFSFKSAIDKFGLDTAKVVAASRVAAIDRIEAIVNELGIDCDFKRVDGYYYAEREENIQHVKDEYESSKQAGLDVLLTENAPLPFPTHNAVIFKNQARFNSQQYLNGIAGYLASQGVRIYEHSRVTDLDHREHRLTTEGGEVRFEQVVMATHLPLFIDALQTLNYAYRSYLVVADVQNPPEDALYWDQYEPYFYTRLLDGNKILVGGADHQTGHQREDEDYYQQLKEYTLRRYQVHGFYEQWSAQWYEPADGLPYIGESPFKNTYVATGFSGDGLVYGTVAAMILSDLLTGKENDWLDVYNARRFDPLKAAGKFVKKNTEVVGQLISDRLPAKGDEEPAPGEGKIMSVNNEKMAVFRDETGQLTYFSPVCPHMKCHVNWNHLEKSWDCPCHGSRFDREGKVIIGPAVTGLENKTMAAAERE